MNFDRDAMFQHTTGAVAGWHLRARTAVLFAFIVGAHLLSAGAARAVCLPPLPPEVHIDTVPTEIVIDSSKPADEVIRIGRGSSQSSEQPPHKLGLSRVTATVGLKAGVRIDRSEANELCASAARIEVRIAYSERRVLVAREAARDACVLTTVVSHALRHARGEEVVLSYLAENYVRPLQRRLTRVTATGLDQRAAEEALNAKLKPEIDELMRLLDAGVAEAAAKADHDEELSRVFGACNGAVKNVLDSLASR